MIGHRKLNPQDYWSILDRRKWILAGSVVLFPLLALALCLLLPKRYTSETTVLVAQPAVPESYVTSITSGELKERLSSMQEQILSRSGLESIIDQLNLYADERNKVPMEALVDRLQSKIVVKAVKPMAETNSRELPGFTVKASDHDPALAQKICTEVINRFLNQTSHIRQQQAQQMTTFIGDKLAAAKLEMNERDAKLAAFKSQYIGALPDDQQANLSILAGLNTQLDASTQEVDRAQQDKAFAESMLQQEIANAAQNQSGTGPTSLQKQLADAQKDLADLQTKYTADHPDVIRAKQNIQDLKQKIASSAGDTSDPKQAANPVSTVAIDQLRAQVHQYDATIAEKSARQKEIQRQIGLYQSRLQVSPKVEEQLKQLTRDYTTASDAYNDLLKKRGQSAMDSDLNNQKESMQFRVLDPPNLPDSPSFPIRAWFLLGGVALGLIVAIGSSLLLEAQDRTIRTEQDVELFLHLPTLALIPRSDNGIGHELRSPSGVNLVGRA
jgi:polysaccharide chain length determinant protein (PEP-CTERM system associated)